MSTFQSYLDINAINWSSLKAMHVSALAYRWWQDHPSPDKPAYQLGRATHSAILEPESFATEYVVYPGKVRRGKAWEEFQEENGWCEIITANDMELAETMAAAVQVHPVASTLLSGGDAEVNLEWTDPVTGMKCKGRADYLTDRVIDLKTAREVDPRRFSRAIADYQYHGQLAYYHDGWRRSMCDPDSPVLNPIIIAVQSQPPYDVAVYQMTDEAMDAGRALYRGLLDRLAECMATDTWPGVAGEVVDVELPPWAAGTETDNAPALTMGGKEMKF